MKVLASSPNIVELEKIQSYLDELDIASHIAESRNAYISAEGNVYEYSLLVADGDVDSAKIVLARHHAAMLKSEPKPWCPDCGCETIEKKVVHHSFGSIWFLLAGLLMIGLGCSGIFNGVVPYLLILAGIGCCVQFVVGYKEQQYRCTRCNHIFKRY